MATANSKVSVPSARMDRYLGPSIFKDPVCLIYSAPDGKLVANEKAVRQLEKIEQTINCVAIAGPYRTGKSYLLNRLAGKRSGFPLGSTIQSKTKGIWVWCIPHPVNNDQVLVLLDTEGLGDIEKGDKNHDNWIFALAVLLSSTLVFNAMGVIDQGAIEKLNFVTEMSKHIKTKEHGPEGNTFAYYFPTFVFCLRDFGFTLHINGRAVTADAYLEHALTYKEESDETSVQFNEPRKCIRKYFERRKCFTFVSPARSKELCKLETLKDSELDEDFVSDTGEFCRYIYRDSQPKKLDIGTPVTGRMFASLVMSYVNAIRSGAVPCIENALNTMAKSENTKAIEEGVKLYQEFMTENLSLPTDSDDTLSQVHRKAVEKSVTLFVTKAIYDIDQKYQHKMNKQITTKYDEWKKTNEQAYVNKCKQALQNLNTNIAKKLEDGVYMCKGGYAMYKQDLNFLEERYRSIRGSGERANNSLLAFLKEKWTEGQIILKADKNISEKENKLEEQRKTTVEAERLREAAERGQKASQSQLNRLKHQLYRLENEGGGGTLATNTTPNGVPDIAPNYYARPLGANFVEYDEGSLLSENEYEYSLLSENEYNPREDVLGGKKNKKGHNVLHQAALDGQSFPNTKSKRMHNRLYKIIGDELPTSSQEFQSFKDFIPLCKRDKDRNAGSAEDLLRIWEVHGGISLGNYANLLQLLLDTDLIQIRNRAKIHVDQIQRQLLAENGSPLKL